MMMSPLFLLSLYVGFSFRVASVSAFVSGALHVQRPLLLQPLRMAGFGGIGSGGKKKKKGNKNKAAVVPQKLKAKTQWDRYCVDLKKSESYSVAVRVTGGDEGGEWVKVGKVKSDGVAAEVAVILQRGIIAEHSKRLRPDKVKPKDAVEWGYSEGDGEEFTLADKTVASTITKGTEKKVGFEGLPDPNTGSYCHYKEGRLVDKSDDAKQLAHGATLDMSSSLG
eukprot:CAMPEP_0113563128 /NCGR_PEP_ID=MMETSP0015_2-20120614/20897_1 /TAXON_ID=2838 /ORGANISM="Odontella" /LENGTH=222 /DNA_ID=CAMNT_0000465075 /DNA_START=83 /DNA_END=752 /DNA_ORIENTATION=- /assembly_acc=CAM_ASM_000160